MSFFLFSLDRFHFDKLSYNINYIYTLGKNRTTPTCLPAYWFLGHVDVINATRSCDEFLQSFPSVIEQGRPGTIISMTILTVLPSTNPGNERIERRTFFVHLARLNPKYDDRGD